jgi:hypothetical protein
LVSNYKGDEISLLFVPKPETYGAHVANGNFATVMKDTVMLYRQITPAMVLQVNESAAANTAHVTNSVNSDTTSAQPTSHQAHSSPTEHAHEHGGAAAAPQKITPTPGFVVKTRDSQNSTVFINVCHHESVPPYSHSHTITNLLTGGILNKQVCYIFGPTNVVIDRDGGECMVIPCVVNTDSYNAFDKHQGATSAQK